jgi:small subunit ribosomal protein S20
MPLQLYVALGAERHPRPGPTNENPQFYNQFFWRTKLANIKSQIKRNRQNEKRRLRNRVYRGNARTQIKKARLAIEEGSVEDARQATLNALIALDKAASKGVLHKNNAARRKSRLMKHLAELETQAAA